VRGLSRPVPRGTSRTLRRVQLVTGAAVAVALLTSGCTAGQHGPDHTVTGPDASQGSGTARALLPDFCDELLTPLTVASALPQKVAGGRTAEYEQPRPGSGLRAGMTCRYGIGPGGAVVTVIARAYADEPAARTALSRVVRAGPGDDSSSGIADRVRVAGASGVVTESPEAAAAYLREGQRVLAVTVRLTGTSGDDGRGPALQIATAVVRGLPDTQ
jgi:hypothetical protein